MSKQPARATRLNHRVSMEAATDRHAKRAIVQQENKARLKAMPKPKTVAEKMTMAVALIHARDSEQFTKETRQDAPLRGIDQISLGRTAP